MKDYSPRWKVTIFAAIVIHFAAAVIISLVLPQSSPEKTIADVSAFEWVDVDLSDELTSAEADEISAEPVKETSSPFSAQDLFVPELKIPDLPTVEEIPKPAPIERPKPVTQKPPPVVTPKPPAQSKVEAPENRELVQPPVTLREVHPEKGSGLGYKGFVSIAATVGTDGKVHDTEIIQSSGRYFVDEIARKYAAQWTFKPALDQNGKPMECYKIITFDFRRYQ